MSTESRPKAARALSISRRARASVKRRVHGHHPRWPSNQQVSWPCAVLTMCVLRSDITIRGSDGNWGIEDERRRAQTSADAWIAKMESRAVLRGLPCELPIVGRSSCERQRQRGQGRAQDAFEVASEG